MASQVGDQILLEAEDFTIEDLFRIETLPGVASGDQGLRLPFRSEDPTLTDGATGRATTSFEGPAGVYAVEFGYFDEDDGQSRLALEKNGEVVESFLANSSVGPGWATSNNRLIRTFENTVELAPGDELAVTSELSNLEFGRVDFVRLTVVALTGDPNAPDAVGDSATVAEGDGATPLDVLANDTDLNDPVPVAITIIGLDTGGLVGTAAVASDGKSVTYDPNGALESLALGASATETFTYTIDDAAGNNDGSDTASVTVTVTGENDAPSAAAIALTANEDGPAAVGSFDGDDVDSDD
ncbi:MAG: Ig-like domain-containing protein, partial [Pseudomonadota bacterium]